MKTSQRKNNQIKINDLYLIPKQNERKSFRRSTFVSLPLPNENCFIPLKEKWTSDQSIVLIKENSSCPIEEDIFQRNCAEEKLYLPGATGITLTLPITSNTKYFHPHEITNPSEQFTLSTNPPITVTIEPQNHLNERIEKENSFHDDQIYSAENVHLKEEKDPSFKNPSTIVNYLMDLLKPSDNKLAMKLFGSRKGVLKERLRQQRAGHCIIHPCSNFRFYWDLIMLILLINGCPRLNGPLSILHFFPLL